MSKKELVLASLPDTLKSIIAKLTPRLRSILQSHKIPAAVEASILIEITSKLNLSISHSLPLLKYFSQPETLQPAFIELDPNLLYKYFNVLSLLKQETFSLQDNESRLKSIQHSVKSAQRLLGVLLGKEDHNVIIYENNQC